SRQFSEALPPVIQLRPYQQRWVDDSSLFKGAVKSARIGFSFGTGIEAILDCIERGSTWTVLSASKPNSVEFVDMAAKSVKAIGAVSEYYEEEFADEMGASDILVQRIQFANGGRIIALPANPRTARGYPGNAILDEFAHAPDSYAIWAAVARQVALGHKLRVLSTPNGEQGKFFDLAKEFGLSEGVEPSSNPVRNEDWSWHWVDVHRAIAEGCPISERSMRNLFKDDALFSQEFLCVFLKALGAWLSLELIAAAEDDNATTEFPAGWVQSGRLTAGIDVARHHDQTVMWIDEHIGDIAWTRAIIVLHAMPFFGKDGKPGQAELLDPYIKMCDRVAIDSTGIGSGLYDYFDAKHRAKMMGVNFAGSTDKGVRIKTEMALLMKKELERQRFRIPRDPQIRQELLAIKREATSTGVKFDAPRIEVETGVSAGPKKKMYAHADRFWAKAMSALAAGMIGDPSFAVASAGVVAPERRGMMSEMSRIGNVVQDEMVQSGLAQERRSLFR
ncbi:MAG: putative bacteriophage portal protein, partial [Candidatus Angelobacter sp.]|nr:putative bacteriophage portal protein [Candidatus Angelobacter sp.]